MCVTLSDAILTQYSQANSPISWVKLSSFMSHELVMNLKNFHHELVVKMVQYL
jgi:hypothetical protein